MSKRSDERNTVLYSAPNIIRKIGEFYLVLNPEAPNMMVVDEIGKKTLELCKKNDRRDHIVKSVSREFDCAEQDVEHFIDSLTKTKFVAENSAPSFLRERIAAKLETLQLHLTQACNLACKHCYFSSGDPFKNELGDEEYLSFAKSLRRMGISSLAITGGEPLMRRDLLFKLLDEVHSQGIEAISLSTNGTLVTEDDAVLFKKHNVKVGVSLDGGTAETHDYIRGKGVFDKAVAALKILRDSGVYTTIGVTLMKANIEEVEKIMHLARELSIPSVFFSTVRVKGRAAENLSDTEIPAKDAVAALMKIWELSRNLGIRTSVEAHWRSLKELQKKELCGAGKALLCVAANGDVYPCDAFHGEPTFKAGNIREKPLNEIWQESSVLKPFFEISIDKVEGCRDCELKYVCGGGCMEDNFEAHRTLSKVSPWCLVLKDVFWQMLPELAKEMWQGQ